MFAFLCISITLVSSNVELGKISHWWLVQWCPVMTLRSDVAFWCSADIPKQQEILCNSCCLKPLTKMRFMTPNYYPNYQIKAIEKMVNNPFKQWRWSSLECDPTWGDDSQTIGLYGSEGWVAVGWLAFKADTFHK